MYSLIMEILYVSTFATITVIINRVSKIVIICKYIMCSLYEMVHIIKKEKSVQLRKSRSGKEDNFEVLVLFCKLCLFVIK